MFAHSLTKLSRFTNLFNANTERILLKGDSFGALVKVVLIATTQGKDMTSI